MLKVPAAPDVTLRPCRGKSPYLKEILTLLRSNFTLLKIKSVNLSLPRKPLSVNVDVLRRNVTIWKVNWMQKRRS